MALSERSRSVLYQGLVTIVENEQAVQEMMSYFPARDVEEPVTKDFLRAEMNDLRAEMRTEMGDLRAEMRIEMGDLRAEMGQMEGRLVDRINRMTAWNVATLIAFAAVLVAAVRI